MIYSSGVGCATIQPQQGTWTNERPKLVKLKKKGPWKLSLQRSLLRKLHIAIMIILAIAANAM